MDLPNTAERKQIFSIQLAKRKRNPANYDLDRVAEGAKGFSGAEIESAVQTALYAAFSRKQELSNEDLLHALETTVPLSVTRAEEIAEFATGPRRERCGQVCKKQGEEGHDSEMEGRISSPEQQMTASMPLSSAQGGWIVGCTAVAGVFCLSEYGCAPVPFFAITFYTLTGIIRLFLYWSVRWLSR